jgi:hypothetical protein
VSSYESIRQWILHPPSWQSQERFKIRRWWEETSGRNWNFAGLYNNGQHLFAWPAFTPPGSFIVPPTILAHFPYVSHSAVLKLRDLTFIHKGHMFGLSGGNATVCVMRGPSCASNVVIPQDSIVYFIQVAAAVSPLTFVWNTQRARLPISILEPV